MKEKLDKFIKSRTFIIALIILFMISIIILGTQAWFTWNSPTTTNLTMTIGNLADVVFTNGPDINTTNLSPVFNYYDGEKTTIEIVSQNSNTTETLKYTIALNITTIDNELISTSLKYKLVKVDASNNRTSVADGDFSNASNGKSITVLTNTLTSTSIKYEFYIYIDGNIENNPNMMNKTLTGTISISGKGVTTSANYISNIYTNAAKTTVTNNRIYNYANIYDTDSDDTTSGGLMDDKMIDEAGNIRYYGANPNNYIYFNCSDYTNQSADTCEIWRIIGTFKDIELADGTKQNLVKIIRNESIGYYSWDNKDATTGAESDWGKNDWSTARLMKLLNPSDYYTIDPNDKGYGQSLYWNSKKGTCFRGLNNTTAECDFTSTGIKNDETRNKIAEVTWNLGGNNDVRIFPDLAYNYERGTIVYSGNPIVWIGKIALMYPSDYGYATDFTKCKTWLDNYYGNLTGIGTVCKDNDWLYYGNGQNVLTPNSGDSKLIWYVNSSGNASFTNPGWHNPTFPTLFLNADEEIISGDGSSSSPYKLGA